MDDDEAIAIVGIGCRMPGGDNKEKFWKLLKNGEDHVIPIPKDRWNTDVFYDPDPDKCGKTYTRCAGIIEGAEAWDNNFFGISDEEATVMDPQQSMALECTYKALEDAGITKRDFSGTNTGVFMGCMYTDYNFEILCGSNEKGMITPYVLTGTPQSIISARLSYVFNLLGPSMTLDTACSSSLVAIHQAASAIRLGDCTAAVCGGVNFVLSPEPTMGMSRSRIASVAGKCHTFSSKADGYVRGEGCGIVILKKLCDARRDGNKIWATLVSGCNQDGHTATPMTAPSGEQQFRLLQHVYKRFNVDPSTMQYIECHGTGTPRGDPTEVNSLGTHFSSGERKSDIYIGSVKTNIGHLEAASGVAGLIKVLLMMKHSLIVPNLHYDPPNPNLRFADYKFKVPKTCTEWLPDEHGRHIACVNSFGFGGTNAHVVIQSYGGGGIEDRHKEAQPCLMTISAPFKSSLLLCVSEFIENVNAEECSIEDVSFTSVRKRNHYPYRISLVARNLQEIDADKLISKVHNAENRDLKAPNVIFVFCGVGTCWSGMCKRLMNRFTIFKDKLLQIDLCLKKHCEVSLVDLFENVSDFNSPFLSHLSIFATQICLAALWKHWGVVPNSVVGQSVGEVAAFVTSGALTLEEGVAVIYYRSKYLSEMCEGEMVVCLGAATSTVEECCRHVDGVGIAVYISPVASTVSGTKTGTETFKTKIAEQYKNNGLKLHDLPVTCAYHSKYVSKAAQKLSNALENIQTKKPRVPVYSTVTGRIMDDNVTQNYWLENVLKPVQFQQAIKNAFVDSKTNVFVEIGPRPVLSTHINDILPSSSTKVLPSITRNNDELQLLDSLGTLYEMGVELNWDNLPCFGNITDIPRSVFERQRVLKFPNISKKWRSTSEHFQLSHVFLKETADENAYELQLREETVAFAYGHYVRDYLVLPGATYVEAAMVAGKIRYSCHYSCKIKFDKFLFLENDNQLSMVIEDSTVGPGCTFKIIQGGNSYAHGLIHPTDTPKTISYDLEQLKSSCKERVEKTEIYSRLRLAGFNHGPRMQLLQYGLVGKHVCFSELLLNDYVTSELGNTLLHPCILDACLQTTVFSFQQTKNVSEAAPYAFGSIQKHLPVTKKMYVVSYPTKVLKTKISHDFIVLNDSGGLVLEIRDFVTKLASDTTLATRFKYSMEWSKFSTLQSFQRDTETPTNGKVNTVILTYSEKVVQLHKITNTKWKVALNINSLIGAEGREFYFKKFTRELLAKWKGLEEVHLIIYQPGITLDESLLSPIDVHNKVMDQCYSLILLIRALKQNNLDIPVVLMTENALLISRNDVCNPTAASMWGLGRCIMLEVGVSRLLLLLDVVSNEDSIECCKLDFHMLVRNGRSECAVRNGKLYVNHLIPAEDSTESTYRKLNRDLLSQAILKSKAAHRLEEPFLIYRSPVNECPLADGFRRLLVKTICLHNPVLYPATETAASDVLSAPVFIEGHNVLTFEVFGNLLPSLKDDVTALYPVCAGRYVDVPTECIIQVDASSWYKPGLLTKMALVISLVSCIEKKSNVTILIDEHALGIEEFIDNILKRQHISRYNIISLANVYLERKRIYSTILCLVSVTRDVCTMLEELWETPSRIVSLSSLLDGPNVMTLSKQHHAFDIVSKSVNEILNARSCRRLVTVVKKSIKKVLKDKKTVTFVDPSTFDSSVTNINSGVLSPNKVLDFNRTKNEVNNTNLSLSSVRVTEKSLFRKDCCYIVIGGMSGLGWEIMRMLAELGAGYIVSTSRRTPSESQQQTLIQMGSNHHCYMSALSADINDLNSLQELVETISKRYPSVPIKGIFHGAAVSADESVLTISREKFERGLLPKVLGTWNLHLASRTLTLDYFVTHSSITGLIGNITQTNYGAGCTFQDAVMLYRRKHGFAGQTINWGAINAGLAVENENVIGVLKHHGISLMESDTVKKCLVDTLMHDHGDIVYCDINWKRLYEEQNRGTDVPFKKYEKLVKIPKARTAGNVNNVLGTNDDDGMTDLVDQLKGILANTISVDASVLTPETNLVDLGMDSLTSLGLINKLNADLNVTVPLMLILSPNVSIFSLACFIVGEKTGGTQTDEINTDHSEELLNTHL